MVTYDREWLKNYFTYDWPSSRTAGLDGYYWTGWRLIDEINDNHEYLIVVATGKQAVRVSPEVLWHWSDARFLIGVGIDGADKRLLNVLEDEPVGVSTGSIHIWSGDHCFAPITRKLRQFGCDVRVFSEQRSLSRELKSAASAVQTFKGPFTTADDVFVSREVQVA